MNVKYSKFVILTTLYLKECAVVWDRQMWESTLGLTLSATDINIAYQKHSVSPRAMWSIKEARTRCTPGSFTIPSAHSPHKCLILIFSLPLIILYLTVGLWKLKSHCLSQHISYQRSLSWYYSHSTREFKLSADIISQSGCYTSRSLKVMSRCVSYIPYSAVSCSALFYGGCLGL